MSALNKTTKIKMKHGFEVLVDSEDFKKVNEFTWHKDWHGYAVCSTLMLSMHRFIMNTPNGLDTDHINGNKLDNRKDNLRVCTRSENIMNSKKRRILSSRFKGVSWNTKRRKWQVFVNRKYIGQFNDEIEAAKAYDCSSQTIFGEFYKPNFLEEKVC